MTGRSRYPEGVGQLVREELQVRVRRGRLGSVALMATVYLMFGAPAVGLLILAAGILWYLVAAAVAAVIYTLSRPWRTSRFRSVGWGALAELPGFALFVGAVVLLDRSSGWSPRDGAVVATGAALMSGGLWGWFDWSYRDDR